MALSLIGFFCSMLSVLAVCVAILSHLGGFATPHRAVAHAYGTGAELQAAKPTPQVSAAEARDSGHTRATDARRRRLAAETAPRRMRIRQAPRKRHQIAPAPEPAWAATALGYNEPPAYRTGLPPFANDRF